MINRREAAESLIVEIKVVKSGGDVHAPPRGGRGLNDRPSSLGEQSKQGELSPPLEPRRTMKPMTNLIGSHQGLMLSTIADAIRSVSSKARELPILPGSLLQDELALDSLDLVAVILEVQDRFQVEIDPDEIPNLRTVDDLMASVSNHLQAAA